MPIVFHLLFHKQSSWLAAILYLLFRFVLFMWNEFWGEAFVCAINSIDNVYMSKGKKWKKTKPQTTQTMIYGCLLLSASLVLSLLCRSVCSSCRNWTHSCWLNIYEHTHSHKIFLTSRKWKCKLSDIYTMARERHKHEVNAAYDCSLLSLWLLLFAGFCCFAHFFFFPLTILMKFVRLLSRWLA